MPLFALLDAWRAPAPAPSRVAWLDRHTYAHRGLHGPQAPENSMAAFEAAVEAGLGIELDVQRSSDGQPVVFHDWELDRMTHASGPVARFSAEQLANTALNGGGSIPMFGEVLAAVAGRVPVLIEVKSKRETRVPALCLAVRRALEGYQGPHAVISFDPRVCRWFAVHSPLTVRGLSFTDENDRTLAARTRRRLALWHARPDFITYDLRDLPNRFATVQRTRGLPLVTWTVKTPDQRNQAEALADAWIGEGAGLT